MSQQPIDPHPQPQTSPEAAPSSPRPRRRGLLGAAGRVLSAAQARFVRARAGSVLIIVVALLVLVALAGTALIVTARTDRYATGQNTANTQIEMLVDSVVRLSKAAIIDDLFGQGDYRPATPAEPPVNFASTPAGEYEHYDAPINDRWLASRVPQQMGGARPFWMYITAPLVNGAVFESPNGATYTFRKRAEPTFLATTGEVHPALKIYDNVNGVVGTFLAADADGDGIADSGLWRIPVGQLNGVTYYAGVRIVDNCAAFNANVHWQSNRSYANTPGLPDNPFAVNVDFEQALLASTSYAGYTQAGQMNHLSYYRIGTPGYNTGGAPPASPPPFNAGTDRPINDSGGVRSDFEWISPYDEWYHQFARRIDNPGYYSAGQRFRALGTDDATSIAYRFILRNPNALIASPLEQMLAPTLEIPIDPYRPLTTARTPRTRTQPYPAPPANGVSNPAWIDQWFNENFNPNAAGTWSRRAVTVTRNPMSNAAQMHDMEQLATYSAQIIGNTDTQMERRDNRSYTPRTSINTANFGELWRAFWMVMDAGGNKVPANADGIFRSPLRKPQPNGNLYLSQEDVLVLRAALAAVNAEDLRDSDQYDSGDHNQNVTSHKIHIKAKSLDRLGQDVPIEVTVFGNEAQPFITEVYANNDSSIHMRMDPGNPMAPPIREQNAKGYVAVELYNPTNETIHLEGWHLGITRRIATGANAPLQNFPDMLVMPITGFNGFSSGTGPMAIPPGERLVLENYDAGAGGNAAQYRPKTVDGRVGSRTRYIPNLHEVFEDSTGQPVSGELVLLRPRRGDGGPSTQTGADGYQEMNGAGSSVNLDELVPLDSFDFTGFQLAAPTATEFREMHYVRANEGAAEKRWKCVYPGRWTESASGFRHEATSDETFATPMPPDFETAWSMARRDRAGKDIRLGEADTDSSYSNPYPGIQLNNKDFAGPNPVKQTTNHFPFGAFARNGDILQVPFIGAYTIRTESNANAPRGGGSGRSLVVEMNPVTHDAGRAHDADPAPQQPGANTTVVNTFDDAYEQIGHFCPLRSLTPLRYDPNASPPIPNPTPADPYAWASDLFDYLTVEAPHADFLPNVRQENYGTWQPTNGTIRQINPDPDRVQENDSSSNAGSLEGKININTASWRVLAGLPFYPSNVDSSPQDGADDRNELIAKMIVKWRDGDFTSGDQPKGPFYSLYDLNRVVDAASNLRFQSGGNGANADDPAFQPSRADGDYSDSDNVSDDFEGRYLMLNRISNLVTTRSDSYTVYIVVEGWRGVSTQNPTLVVRRRAAYLADRSGITNSNRDFTPIFIPTN